MKKGLVFGKFMPLHIGHQKLIEFGLKHCDRLHIILCHTINEPIHGMIRKEWLIQSVRKYKNISVASFLYNSNDLPNTSVSSRYASELWAKAFKVLVPDVEIVFTSENYGKYLAEYMGIEHHIFDKERTFIPVSATVIRKNPFYYWTFIAEAAKPWFVKKIALVGSESTGKSILAERHANYFNTEFVPEMAREIIEKTYNCNFDDLLKIAELHAQTIVNKTTTANKLLFVDTDLNLTKSYSQFLFHKDLIVDPWIENVNRFDLYIFLEPDCAFIQDGTRLSLRDRNELNIHHKTFYEIAGVSMFSISGNWEERFKKAVLLIEQTYFITKAPPITWRRF